MLSTLDLYNTKNSFTEISVIQKKQNMEFLKLNNMKFDEFPMEIFDKMTNLMYFNNKIRLYEEFNSIGQLITRKSRILRSLSRKQKKRRFIKNILDCGNSAKYFLPLSKPSASLD